MQGQVLGNLPFSVEKKNQLLRNKGEGMPQAMEPGPARQ